MIKKAFERKAQEEGGFTLVELLVVILIIGILAAVAIPAFLGQRQRANDAAVVSDVKNVATQIESALVAAPNAEEITGTAAASDDTITVTLADGAGGVLETAEARLSEGVSITVTAGTDPGTYEITGNHTNGTDSLPVIYNSADGGIQ